MTRSFVSPDSLWPLNSVGWIVIVRFMALGRPTFETLLWISGRAVVRA